MIVQKLPSIRGILGSASARNHIFGEKTTLKTNRTDREGEKYVVIDRNTGYDDHEETWWPLVSATENPIWEIPAKTNSPPNSLIRS